MAAIGLSSITQAATYEITEIATFEDYKQHFPSRLNNAGDAVGLARDAFNTSFYWYDYLTEEDGTLRSYCDVSDEDVTTQTLDNTSNFCVKYELTRTVASGARGVFSSSPYFQKLGETTSFYSNNGATETVVLADEVDSELGGLTGSTVEQLYSLNDSGMAVGTTTAPFFPISYTQTGEDAADAPVTIWQREYQLRGAVLVNGTASFLEPLDSSYGGASAAFDISNTNDEGFIYVAGYQSVAVNETAQESIDADCNGELLPVSVCAWAKSVSAGLFEIRPAIWKLDSSANLVETLSYELAFTPDSNQTGNYSASVVAVNNAGVGVGYGHVPDSKLTQPVLFPLIFKDGTTTEVLSDHGDYYAGYATDINNQNAIVGKVQTFLDGTYHDHFFIYHLENDQFETPVTFFPTAESNANAINNAGLVVGEAEYEIINTSVRRKHGFIYNSVSNEFFDVNDLTECDASLEVVELKDINDNEQLLGTALKTVDKRDSLGELIYENGEVATEQIVVPVILTPIEGGTVDDCAIVEDTPYKRIGGSINPLWLLLSIFVLAIRTKF